MADIDTLDSHPVSAEKLPRVGSLNILSTLSSLELVGDSYFVIGGANLVLRGIKPGTIDIDMLVSQDTFDFLAGQPGAEIHEPPERAKAKGATNQSVWVNNAKLPAPVSAAMELGDGYYPMSFESHRSEIEIVAGIPCLLLEHVKAAKEALQRPRDIIDLAAIASFLGETMNLPKPTIVDPYPDSRGWF